LHDVIKHGKILYCFDEGDMYLTGFSTSKLYNRTYEYLRVEVLKCDESTRITGDPVCSSDAAINRWTARKKFQITMLDYYTVASAKSD